MLEPYSNTLINIQKRAVFAAQLIWWLKKKYRIINVDESGFNVTNTNSYSWTQRKVSPRNSFCRSFKNITMAASVDLEGRFHYALIKESHTGNSFATFLKMLCERLTVEDTNWRNNTVVLIDNAKIHDTARVRKTIKDERIPLAYTAPASYLVLPIELCFAKIKQKYSAIHAEKMESFYEQDRKMAYGEPGRMVEASIVEAIERTSERVLMASALK